jgi:Domain of unknown function (DUF5666)
MNRNITTWPQSLLTFCGACVLALGIAATGSAGIQGSGFRLLAAFGTVDAGGGLTVNGLTYDASGARVTINGRKADTSKLHSGHVVAVAGAVAADGDGAVAQEVTLTSDVRGEVTSVDAGRGKVEVLGQTLYVDGNTVLDPVIAANGLATLQPGAFVNVSGFARTDGSLAATSLDLDAAPDVAQVRGVIQSLDQKHQSFRIGNLRVEYADAAIEGSLATGAIAVVQGAEPLATQALVATRVQMFAGIGREGEKGDLKGIISAFASPADFEVNGQPVLADSKTRYVLNKSTLAADVEVRVTGVFNASGVLLASKVQVDAPHSAAARGKKKPK